MDHYVLIKSLHFLVYCIKTFDKRNAPRIPATWLARYDVVRGHTGDFVSSRSRGKYKEKVSDMVQELYEKTIIKRGKRQGGAELDTDVWAGEHCEESPRNDLLNFAMILLKKRRICWNCKAFADMKNRAGMHRRAWKVGVCGKQISGQIILQIRMNRLGIYLKRRLIEVSEIRYMKSKKRGSLQREIVAVQHRFRTWTLAPLR